MWLFSTLDIIRRLAFYAFLIIGNKSADDDLTNTPARRMPTINRCQQRATVLVPIVALHAAKKRQKRMHTDNTIQIQIHAPIYTTTGIHSCRLRTVLQQDTVAKYYQKSVVKPNQQKQKQWYVDDSFWRN